MSESLGPIAVSPLSGDEPFHRGGSPLSPTVHELWQWACSDLLSNAFRGTIAEYLVANDLGVASGARAEWDAYDLTSKDGTKIEVKSAAYLQSWNQTALSPIRFSIGPSRAWSSETGQFEEEVKRQADVYVFCLLDHKDKATVDPLNVDQWKFYVLPRASLDAQVPRQKTIGLTRLLALGPVAAPFGQIDETVCAALGRTG